MLSDEAVAVAIAQERKALIDDIRCAAAEVDLDETYNALMGLANVISDRHYRAAIKPKQKGPQDD